MIKILFALFATLAAAMAVTGFKIAEQADLRSLKLPSESSFVVGAVEADADDGVVVPDEPIADEDADAIVHSIANVDPAKECAYFLLVMCVYVVIVYFLIHLLQVLVAIFGYLRKHTDPMWV